jgi:lipopolysaccharide assembly outer membrane protein LptD (OstA)
MEYNRARNLIIASDNVVITREGEELQADHVQVNTVTHDIEARGHVVFTKAKNVWRGERMRYNFASGAWQTGDFDAYFEPFHVKAGAAEMTNKTEYVLKDAVVTTCTNKQGDWHYSFSCSTLKVTPEDRMIGRHAVVRLGGVPIFYLPFWYRSLGDQTVGVSVEAGYRKRMGLFLLTSTKYWIAPAVRGATQLDYRSERGPAIGQEVGWELGKDSGNGRVYAYYLNDDGVSSDDHYQDSPLIDSQRYRLRFQHGQTFSSRDYLLADATYLSDPFVMEDFFDGEYRNAYQPQNFITATHRGDDWTLGLSIQKRLNDFYTAIDRLPEMTLDINRQQIEGTPFYYESRNALAYLSKANDDSSGIEDYSVGRLDTSHMFYWPTRSFGFLNLMPRAGYRATLYSETVERHSVTQVVTVVTTNMVTGAGGVATPVLSSGSQTNVQETTTELGSDVRSLVELGLEASFRAFKVLSSEENAFGTGLRHVVEPYANYTFIPEPNLRPDNLYQFDSVDRVDKQSTVAMGVRNQFQTKHGSSVDSIMDLDLFTTYDLEDDDDTPFSVFGMKSEFHLASWCRLFMDGTYDSYDSEIDTFNTRVHLESGMWKADAENRYRLGDAARDDTSNLLTANVSMAPSRKWEFGLYERYEIEESRLEEQGVFVTRTLDCLAFKVGGSYLPGQTRTDGSTQDDDFRVSFQMWLTALPNVRVGSAPRN